jgi:CheY-like chemotaxis protein
MGSMVWRFRMTEQTTRQLNILVVEDNWGHLDEAVATVQAAGHKTCMAETLTEATQILGDVEYKIDAVISDVFFPFSYIRNSSGQDYTGNDTPCGISMAMQCTKKDIPVVLCTDGYHHGNKLEWINQLCREMGWMLIDGIFESNEQIYTASSSHKDWAKAIEEIEKMVKKN